MLVDLVVMTTIAFFTWTGFRKGLILEFFSFVGIFIAAVLANYNLETLYLHAISFLKVQGAPTRVDENYYIYIGAYVVSFVFFYTILYFLASALKSLFGKLMLGWIDSAFGGILGLGKGMIFSIFFLAGFRFLGSFNSGAASLLDQSQAIKTLPQISETFLNILPSEIKLRVNSYREDAKLGEFLKTLMNDLEQKRSSNVTE